MKKFQFSLQTLLELREAEEKSIQNELALLLSEQNSFRATQERLKRQIENEEQRYKDRIRLGKFTINDSMQFERFVATSLRAIDVAQDRIEAMEPAVQEVRTRLIEASKQRKVVEKLKERRLAEYNEKIERELFKESDDINQKLYQKKQREGAI